MGLSLAPLPKEKTHSGFLLGFPFEARTKEKTALKTNNPKAAVAQVAITQVMARELKERVPSPGSKGNRLECRPGGVLFIG